MGFLENGKEKTLNFKESQKYQKILKYIAALQLAKIFKIYIDHSNCNHKKIFYGIEQEMHLLVEKKK